jgi:hypothetical protein
VPIDDVWAVNANACVACGLSMMTVHVLAA